MLTLIIHLLVFPFLIWAAPSKVILISWDGFGANVAERTKLKTFEEFRAKSVYSLRAKTVLPANTLVSHTSMLTGVSPTKHKVDWNDWRPENGFIKVPSIFDLVKKSSMKTAMVVAKEKFRHFQRPGAVDWFELKPAAKDVVSSAIKLIDEHGPDLLFLHFAEVDAVGHKMGWLTAEQDRAAQLLDDALSQLMARLNKSKNWPNFTVILTADHGGHDKTHGMDIDSDRLIPWLAMGAKVGSPREIQRQINTYDTAATVAWLLEITPPQDWDGKSVFP